ncbi:MAG: ParA family protein [Alphaproteobacteria bacterium]|nr:ParA family protein [Alphaproteobacteria bacterium]
MAAKVFTIAQQKGGAGKTTIACHLAVSLAMGNGKALPRKVAIVDIDPQQSLARWHGQRVHALGQGNGGLHLSAVSGWRTQGEVDRLKRDMDFVVIDSPPHAETEARIAVRAADLVILPVQPSPMDLWAIQPTLDMARQEKVPVLLVFNRMPPRGLLADEMMARAKELGVPIAKSVIGNRVGFAASLLNGRAIGETNPTSRGAREIASLAREVQRLAAR